MRVRSPVRADQSIDAETAVVGHVAEITAVQEVILLSVAVSQPYAQSLVHPVPDGGAADAPVSVDYVPVLLEIAAGIAHGMGILPHHEGFVVYSGRFPLQDVGIEVTVVPNVGIRAVAVIEDGDGIDTARQFFCLVVHRLDVRADTSLVTEAPKNDARVVAVALNKRDDPVHVCLLPGQILTHHMVGIAVSVRFVIGFVHYVQTPSVAKIIQILAVGVVGGPQEIDVRLLHQAHVLLVSRVVHEASSHGMVVVPVYTLELHLFPVDPEYLTVDLDLLDTKMIVEMFDDRTAPVAELHTERVEVRLLRRPETGVVYPAGEPDTGGIPGGDAPDVTFHFLTVDQEHCFQAF